MMFVNQEEFDILNAVSLNKLLNRVIQMAVEESLRALPKVMISLMAQTNALKEMSVKFYNDNPELVEHKLLVTKLVEEEESKNAGLPIDKILKIVSKRAKSVIATAPDANPVVPTTENLAKAFGVL